MATLSANSSRPIEVGDQKPLPVVASDIIYEGAALGWSSGYVRPLVSGDAFAGFALEKQDNSSGSAGDKNVLSLVRGTIKLSVTGAAAGDEGQGVYATDDNVFTTVQGGSRIGFIERVESSGVALVRIQIADLERLELAGNVPASASFTIGAESANEIVVAVQLLDASGQALAARAAVEAYLSSDANGDALEAPSATLTIAASTDGIAIPRGAVNALGHTSFLLVSESDGDVDVSITQTSGADTHYLVLVMPNGKLVVSEAITFAA